MIKTHTECTGLFEGERERETQRVSNWKLTSHQHSLTGDGRWVGGGEEKSLITKQPKYFLHFCSMHRMGEKRNRMRACLFVNVMKMGV